MIKADLRDDPKQLPFRVGNISLFYTMTGNNCPDSPSGRWIKKLMSAAPAESGAKDYVTLAQAFFGAFFSASVPAGVSFPENDGGFPFRCSPIGIRGSRRTCPH